jgi:hypothetical protein
MKSAILLASVLMAGGIASAGLLVHDSFSYSAGDLTGGNGGSGWSGAWTDSGNPVVVSGAGLAYTDSFGNKLQVSGSALNTADGGVLTTISAREVTDRNAETWISVLIQPQGSFSDFLGVSFYDQGLLTANARFAIEQTGKDLRLVRRAPGTPTPPVNSATFATTIGTTVFAVIHLIPRSVTGGALDQVDVYFNPRLDEMPSSPHASLAINGLQFDRVRVAGQNGRSTMVDELRIGEGFADVTPFIAPVDPDTDGDGLLDSQEIALGLDPNVSDAAFIAALRANPGWVALHSTDEVTDVSIGRLAILPLSPGNFDYSFEILDRHDTTLEAITRQLTVGDRDFLRLNLNTP